MRAAVLLGEGMIACQEVPVPPLGDDQVMVRVESCGICGSDLRYLQGENPWAMHTLGEERANPPKMILGHEFSGVVASAGSPRWRPLIGKRVAVQAFRGCGICHQCRSGRENLCPNTEHIGHGAGWKDLEWNPGAMAEMCPAWGEMCYALPDHVTFDEGVFLDGLGVAVHAVNRAQLRSGEVAFVLGCGPIGLSVAQVAKAYGARLVAVSDVYDKALETARELRLDWVLDARSEDVVHSVSAATGDLGADAIFDTVGAAETLQQAVAVSAPGARIVLMAGLAGGATVEPLRLAGERSVTVSANNNYREFLIGLQLLASGRVKVRPLITHRFPLLRVEEAFRMAANKVSTGAIKVVINPQG